MTGRRYAIDYDHPEGAIITELPDGRRIHRYGKGPWMDDHGRTLEPQPQEAK